MAHSLMGGMGESLLLDCQICQDRKASASPRVLVCHHSFCQRCIEEWYSKNKNKTAIECPLCRKLTPLPEGGVMGLPLDFKAQEAEELMRASMSPVTCQICQANGEHQRAVAMCKTCNRRLCAKCKKAHDGIPLNSGHDMAECLCQLHAGEISHFCQTCLEALCLNCSLDQSHLGHAIHPVAEGVKIARQLLKRDQEVLRKERENLHHFLKVKKEEEETKVDFVNDKLQYTADELIKTIKANVAKTLEAHKMAHHVPLDNAFSQHQRACDDADTALEMLENLSKNSDGAFLSELATVKAETNHAFKIVRQMLKVMPQLPEMTDDLCDLDPSTDLSEITSSLKLKCSLLPVQNEASTEDCTGYPLKVLHHETGGPVELLKPSDVTALEDGSVLLADYGFHFLSRFDTNGHMISKYFIPLSETKLACVTHCDGRIYFCSARDNFVSVVSRQGPYEEIQLDENTEIISLHANQDCLLIGDRTKRRVIKYSFATKELSQIIQDVTPWGITTVKQGPAWSIIISDSTNAMVTMYSDTGTYLQAIGNKGSSDNQYIHPAGVAQIANGNILIVDRKAHKVLEYTEEGTYVRALLSKTKDGIHFPDRIAYRHPYLWITETFKTLQKKKEETAGVLKLFRFM